MKHNGKSGQSWGERVGKGSAEALESVVELYKKNYEDNYQGKRIYYNVDCNYLQCYASLLMLAATLPKEKLQLELKR